ncbi:MAG: hypothetical protein M3144_00115, partial [Actinomycetota bacterium]|nr:hypothetical protein [Actinomycetota bacterium]
MRPGAVVVITAAILAISASVLFWGSAGPVLNQESTTTIPAPPTLGSGRAPEARVPTGAVPVTPFPSTVVNDPQHPAGGPSRGPATSVSPAPTAPAVADPPAPPSTAVPESAGGEARRPSDAPATTVPANPADLGPVRGDSS